MIPFRTQRLATSVTNRILNIYHGLPPKAEAGDANAPEPNPEGTLVDQRIYAPKEPTDAAPQDANAIALAPLLK